MGHQMKPSLRTWKEVDQGRWVTGPRLELRHEILDVLLHKSGDCGAPDVVHTLHRPHLAAAGAGRYGCGCRGSGLIGGCRSCGGFRLGDAREAIFLWWGMPMLFSVPVMPIVFQEWILKVCREQNG